MYGTICRSLFVIVILVSVLLASRKANDILEDPWNAPGYGQSVPEGNVMRCSRRFVPGVCPDAATSVWTFDFQRQNCTERMGCRYATRTNRFRSYTRCMRRCKYLNRIYTQVLKNIKENASLFDEPLLLKATHINDSLRREGADNVYLSDQYDVFPIPEIDEDQLSEKEDTEIRGDQPLTFSLREDETEDMDDIIAPDIDYVSNARG